jgi:hypothetical protein
MAGPTLAIDIARRRFRAVEVSRSGATLRVERVLIEEVPARIDIADANALGEWAGALLSRNGFRRGRATVALSREHVSLKRMTLPTTDPAELPEMVRLSMVRELPFDPADAVIDYVPADEAEGRTTVLAAAMPRSMVDHVRAVAKAAGLRIEQVSLRCMGIAALLRTLVSNEDRAGSAWLALDNADDGVELSVLTEDGLRFSRAAEVAHSSRDSEFAEGIITEAKRSWMSYRIVEDAPSIRGGFIFGEKRINRLVHQALSEMMGVRIEPAERHPRVESARDDLASAWPLAGLLLEPAIGAPSFNFSSPRRPPDRAAHVRQRVLAVAGLAIVVLAGLFAAGFAHVRNLEKERDSLAAQIDAEADGFYRYQRDRARFEHLEQWLTTRVNWLAHFRAVAALLPGPESVVLDEWSGSFRREPEVEFNRMARGDERWRAPIDLLISIGGEATSQSIVDSVRETFVESREYTALPLGPDSQDGSRYPHSFKLALRTTLAKPTSGEIQESEPIAEGERERIDSSGERGDEGS